MGISFKVSKTGTRFRPKPPLPSDTNVVADDDVSENHASSNSLKLNQVSILLINFYSFWFHCDKPNWNSGSFYLSRLKIELNSGSFCVSRLKLELGSLCFLGSSSFSVTKLISGAVFGWWIYVGNLRHWFWNSNWALIWVIGFIKLWYVLLNGSWILEIKQV